MTDAEKEIREALAAGPTPGPWSVETVPTSCGIYHKVGPFPGKRPDYPPRHACLYADYPIPGNPADDELEANARYIAACHPAAIRELLAERDALKADAERYRWLRGDSCPNHSSRWTQWEVRCWKAPSWTGDLRRADLDDAIDAARGKE